MTIKLTFLSVIFAALFAFAGASTLWAQSHVSSGIAPAYYIAEFEVTDREALKPYTQQVESTFAPFSGRYIVRGGSMDALEGDTPKSRLVIIVFDSLEQARAWYSSPQYASIRPIRQHSGHTNAYIVEGLPN
ncbi:DUF1330 domain-containing protein [Phyllobacterium myrsinacearum]|uniref:Uncharacterized protein (DUF1330 family) n=1 Tax=Phyllobacterium myrsinacearum TaxID=28101 RepID=A0A839EJW9_9HYPH|nr:DUF1330 domain-containing protein [Phyllobacterium myrsinacearum]MBA8879162.1 uncharacterized protein (DUF1330 family) [Phyllobacterium myrsinacearum]